MTFEEWKRRPVYVAQCYTWKKAAELDLCTPKFRLLPAYRDQQSLADRAAVARLMRAERQARRLH